MKRAVGPRSPRAPGRLGCTRRCSEDGRRPPAATRRLALAVAASGESDRAPSGPPSEIRASIPADAPPATMKLLDPGSPRAASCGTPGARGQRETLIMDLRTSASTEEGTSSSPRSELPPVHIVVAIDPQATSRPQET